MTDEYATPEELAAAGYGPSQQDQSSQGPSAPDQSEYATPEELAQAGYAPDPNHPQAEGGFTSLIKSALHSALPTAASLPGMLAGGEAGFQAGMAAAPFLGPAAPAAPLVGSLIGGLAGGYATGSPVAEAQQSLLSDEDKAQMAANRQEHPWMTMAGELMPMAATFQVGKVGDKIAQRLLMGGGMAGIDVAQQKSQGGDINWAEVLGQGVAGAAFTKAREPLQPMAAKAAQFGKTMGERIPGVQAGREFLEKSYPSGRPDLAYNDAGITPPETMADKKSVQPNIRATSDNRGFSQPQPAPSTAEQPFTGFRQETTGDSSVDQSKGATRPAGGGLRTADWYTQMGEPPPAEAPSVSIVRGPQEQADILAAIQSAHPAQAQSENPAPPGTPLEHQPRERPGQPNPTPQPGPKGLTPEEQAQMALRQRPFAEQLAAVQSNKQQPPAAAQAIETSKTVQPPAAAQEAVETSTAKPTYEANVAARLKSIKKSEKGPPIITPEDVQANLDAIRQKNQGPPGKPAFTGMRSERTAQAPVDDFIARELARSPLPEKAPREAVTNTQASDRTTAALRATNDPDLIKEADKIAAMPAGRDKELYATQQWNAMHSKSGEPSSDTRMRNPDNKAKYMVEHPHMEPTETTSIAKAIMYNKIHDVNEQVHQNPDLQPPKPGEPAETPKEIRARAKRIVETARQAAKDAAEKMLKDAEDPDLSATEQGQLRKAALNLGNGKLPVENYTMNSMNKPASWRMQKHASDFLQGKFRDAEGQRLPADEAAQTFAANERLIRGSKEDYATFEQDNRAAAETAKKPAGKEQTGDLTTEILNTIKESRSKDNDVAKAISSERPLTDEELVNQKVAEAYVRNLRLEGYHKRADAIENASSPAVRDKLVEDTKAQIAEAKDNRQAMARKKMPKDGLKTDRLVDKMAEIAGMSKEQLADVQKTVTGKEAPDNFVEKELARSPIDEKTGKPPPPPYPGETFGKAQFDPKTGQFDRIASAHPRKTKSIEEENARRLAQDDYVKRSKEADLALEVRDEMIRMAKLGTPEEYKNILDAHEADTIAKLTPHEQQLYNDEIKPKLDASDKLFDKLTRIDPNRFGPKVSRYITRVPKNVEEGGALSDLEDKYNDPIAGYNYSNQKTPVQHDRAYVGLDPVGGGPRRIISLEDDGYALWDKNVRTGVVDPTFEFKAGEAYTDPQGKKYTMVDPTMAEVEAQSPIRYYRNANLSANIADAYLRKAELNMEFFNGLKGSKAFQEYATNASSFYARAQAAAKGWVRTTNKDFDGYLMEPKMAQVLDDIAQPGINSEPLNYLRRISQAITRTIFWMPTAHIMNVGAHWFVGRGWDWLPTTDNYRRLASTTMEAYHEVINNGPVMQAMRQMGLSDLYASTKMRDPFNTYVQAAGENIVRHPSQWDPLAKVLGIGVKDLASKVYDTSSNVMWAADSMFKVQMVKENMLKGMSMADAIVATEKIIPNYRVQAELLASSPKGRRFQQIIRDPSLFVFSPYHIGMVSAFTNMFKALAKQTIPRAGETAAQTATRSKAEQVDAAGHMLALAFMAFAVKPVLDKMVQAATGNKEAEVHARGPLALPAAMMAIRRGETDPSTLGRDTMTLSPLVNTAFQAMSGRNFAGKPILDPGTVSKALHGSPSNAGKALVQGGEFLGGSLISPLGTIERASIKKQGAARTFFDAAADVKDPSPQAIKYLHTLASKMNRDTKARAKRPPGIAEAQWNKIIGY